MKLEYKNIKWKNFLSYGKIEQNLDIVPGINLLLGVDPDRERSNGSGKSSVFSAISFAQFGKTDRSLKKEQLVNWKNRGNCSVDLTIGKNNSDYRIIRTIKPDSLEIYQDGSLIQPPSDVRDYQKFLEDEILNLDINMFISLISVNLNSLTPIFRMDKGKKRKFLERIFGLKFFSDLNEKANDKLRLVNEKHSSLIQKREFHDSIISELNIQNDGLEKKLNETHSDISVYDCESRLEKLKKEHSEASQKISDLQIERTEKLEEIQELQNDKNNLNNDINIKKSELLNIDEKIKNVDEMKEKMDEVKRKEKELESLYNKLPCNPEESEEHLAVLKEKVEKSEKELKDFNNKIRGINESRIEIESDLKSLTSKNEKLKGKNKCPLCGSEIGADILKNIDAEKKEILDKKDLIHKQIKDTEKKIKDIENSIDSDKKDISFLSDMISKISNLLSIIRTSKSFYKTEDIEELKAKREKIFNMVLPEIADKERIISGSISTIRRSVEDLDEKIRENSLSLNDIVELKDKFSALKEEALQKQKMKTELKSLISGNNEKIKEHRKEISRISLKILKINEIHDYMELIKFQCKDENVKQYAISSDIPYLTQRMNTYLSESGMNFYVLLDKWLDAEIKGPGISENCSYGNLSGGEARSIDLAMQFAILDVARVKAGVFPDILLLDELLDSSIDSAGLEDVLNIVKARQKADNSKVFIITHRQEISDIEVDNVYLARKEDGFSYLEKQ